MLIFKKDTLIEQRSLRNFLYSEQFGLFIFLNIISFSLFKESVQLVAEADYPFAVATNSGPLAMHQDNLAIRRIAIFPKTDVFGLWRKIRGNYLFRKTK